MSYTIKSFNKDLGQVVVYFEPLDTHLTIDLPIENSCYLVGEPLDTYLKGFIPQWAVERKELLAKGIANEDYFLDLVKQSEAEQLENKKKTARTHRDSLLYKSDWVMLSDAGFSDNQVKLFKEYRQALRDVPQQSGFPEDIKWPSVTGEWPNNPEWK